MKIAGANCGYKRTQYKFNYLPSLNTLKIRSLHMGLLLLDNLPRLKKASNFLLDIYGQDLILFKQKLAFLRQKKGLHLDYKEW